MNWRLFAGLALVLLALSPPLNNASDGDRMLEVAESFVYEGNLDVTCRPNSFHREDGTCQSRFYLLQSVALVPFVALGRLVEAVGGTPAGWATEVMAMMLPPLLVAAAAALVFALARERGAGARAALLAALAFAFGTEALTIGRSLFAEPLGAACVALCAWGLVGTGRRRRAVGTMGAALAVMTKPQLLLAAPLAGFALGLRDRRLRPIVLATAGTLAGSLVVLGYNWYRFGDPLSFGGAGRTLYVGGSPGGPSPVLELLDGAAQLLVSPNHSLLFFSPVALLGIAGLLRRPIDRVAAACLGGAAGVFAFAMIQPHGNFWGTRYLVPLLPLACVGVAGLSRRWRRIAVVLVALAAVSQAPNLVSYPERAWDEVGLEPPGAWDLHRLTLVDAWPAAEHQVRDARRTPPESLVQGGDPTDGKERLMIVAQWWWMLPVIGVPAILGLGVSLLALAFGIAADRAIRAGAACARMRFNAHRAPPSARGASRGPAAAVARPPTPRSVAALKAGRRRKQSRHRPKLALAARV